VEVVEQIKDVAKGKVAKPVKGCSKRVGGEVVESVKEVAGGEVGGSE
jgi:hypothetical protein